ncbi:enoyl-CoA hydratase/isomerase family protein [Sedimentitalea sp. HM32M-2]|uniref:enoyl-CoA hydratase/isomerase family protein n=1 Tax=Sedimentitalea sp. HM32M-2 TaxID=3351566 RepID=UPI003643560B
MSDINIRIQGRAGRITLTRPKALNALTYDMISAVEAALDTWRDDDRVALVLIDGAGERAFCAGGDIAQLYKTGTAGSYGYGRQFWRDEYRMNDKIARYPKPVISFLHGFVMGGGVGIGCHGSHRVVCENSQIAMPECGIGLVPDVGGAYLLARAPGRLGEYLGLTGARMGPDGAILSQFATHYVPQAQWPDLVSELIDSGSPDALQAAAMPPPPGRIIAVRQQIDHHFAAPDLAGILASLRGDDGEFATDALKLVMRNSPLSMGATLSIIDRLRQQGPTLRGALELEFRYVFRTMEHGDFLEGIRAAIIDKDRNPTWRQQHDALTQADIDFMLAPLGDQALRFEEE